MNNDIHSMPSINQLPQAARELSRLATDAASEAAQRTTAASQGVAIAAKDIFHTLSSKVEDDHFLSKKYQHDVDDIRDAAHRATDAAEDVSQSASAKARGALVSTKEYVHQNPFPVALGALIAGVTIGCIIGMTQREEPTFRQRFFR